MKVLKVQDSVIPQFFIPLLIYFQLLQRAIEMLKGRKEGGREEERKGKRQGEREEMKKRKKLRFPFPSIG